MNNKNTTEYRILNLASGDNIIGKMTSKSESSVIIYRPFQMKIITMMDSAGPKNMFRQEALIMRNWLELSDDQEVEIPTSQIISTTQPSEKVTELYNEEINKEDNPAFMLDLLNQLKTSDENENEEEIEFPDYPEEDMENIMNKIDPDDISEIVTRIIEDSLNFNNKDARDNIEDNNDTDEDMYGW